MSGEDDSVPVGPEEAARHLDQGPGDGHAAPSRPEDAGAPGDTAEYHAAKHTNAHPTRSHHTTTANSVADYLPRIDLPESETEVKSEQEIYDSEPDTLIETKEDKSKKASKLKKLGVGALVVAVGAGVWAGVNSSDRDEQKPAPTAAAPADPSGETSASAEPTAGETELSYEEEVAALEIPAGLSAEELANTYVADRMTAWLGAGSDDSIFDDEGGIFVDWTKVSEIEKHTNKLFTDALFVEDWKDKPDLVAESEKKLTRITPL